METSVLSDPLWKKLEGFELDDPEAVETFTDRLAREQGWDRVFTVRAIREYKRFICLIVSSGHSCTPSKVVDEVWHLHLIYTESYWNDMCRDLLGKEIHHNPTMGGGEEEKKFSDWYKRTLELYEKTFEQKPPPDIWPQPLVSR